MEIFMRFPGGKPKAFTMSYDDGVETDVRLIEIMKKYGLYGTFNINAGLFVREGTTFPPESYSRRMSRSKILACYTDSGMEVACHGYTHCFMDKMPVARCTYEVLRDREELEAMFGTIIRGMAYPYGTTNDSVVAALAASGIVYCRTTVSTHDFRIPTDWLRLPATCHHCDPEVLTIADKFVEEKPVRDARLFYLWGHSYEFLRDNNWDLIENIAKKVGGHDDVWYATNIQIYDYVKAYNSLEFNTVATKVHNPTATTVFFVKDRKQYTVAPGQTLDLI